MKLGMQVGLSPSHIVLDGDPAPKGSTAPILSVSAHVCYGQTAKWIEMALGVEVSLRPCDFVLDGDPEPLPK